MLNCLKLQDQLLKKITKGDVFSIHAAFKGKNWLRWLADVLPRQWARVPFPWKKLLSMWGIQAGSCVCLPTRYKTSGHSHPCVICNFLQGGRKGSNV
eukprot:4258009-Ditylum_brightwellii.AAC.1